MTVGKSGPHGEIEVHVILAMGPRIVLNKRLVGKGI